MSRAVDLESLSKTEPVSPLDTVQKSYTRLSGNITRISSGQTEAPPPPGARAHAVLLTLMCTLTETSKASSSPSFNRSCIFVALTSTSLSLSRFKSSKRDTNPTGQIISRYPAHLTISQSCPLYHSGSRAPATSCPACAPGRASQPPDHPSAWRAPSTG